MNTNTAMIGAASVFFLCATPSPAPEKISLTSAVKQKKVSLVATSTGMNSEECVKLELKNISGKPLKIEIPAGTLFDSANQHEQDILVTRQSEAILAANQSTTAKAYGFCCQATNAVPMPGSTFNVSDCTNEKLVKVATYLNNYPFNISSQQSAVWAVSDKHSVGGIFGSGKDMDSLRTFTARLTGQDVPFYKVDYGYIPNTAFVYAPKTLEGNMDFKLDNPGKGTLVIYDPEGEPFQVFFYEKHMTRGTYSQHFRYTATNMIPGEYRVRMLLNNELVSERKITL
jgi:hypothetical protein